MQPKNEIKIGDYVTDKLDGMITGIVIAKGFIGRDMPGLKLERPDGEIAYAAEDNAKLIVSKEALEEVNN